MAREFGTRLMTTATTGAQVGLAAHGNVLHSV